MAYLLQETGGRLTLEDGSGFLLLEAAVFPPTPAAPAGGGGVMLLPEPRTREDEDALMTVLAILT